MSDVKRQFGPKVSREAKRLIVSRYAFLIEVSKLH